MVSAKLQMEVLCNETSKIIRSKTLSHLLQIVIMDVLHMGTLFSIKS